MYKERLKKMIEQKEAELKDKRERSQRSEDVKELRQLGEDIDKIIAELNDLKALYAAAAEPAPGQPDEEGQRKLQKLGEYRDDNDDEDDVYSSIKYRKAFQKYIRTGEMSAEYRDSTKTTDVPAVIPTNLTNKILEKFEQLGVIYNLVTKTSYAVGETIPKEGAKPVATWVNEGQGSTPQKATTGGTITFTKFKLRCELRMTEETYRQSLSSFESWFVKQVGKAMLRAIESAIVDGDGTNKPTGILNYAATLPAEQKITIAAGATNKLTYQTLCDAEAAIPVEYEETAKWVMTKKTFMKFVGMVDDAKQPIARVNYGIHGKPERTLLGRDVVIYSPQQGSKLGTYQDAATTDIIFAFIVDFEDYTLNTIYDLGIQHATDWDNEDHKTKAVLSCDGKLLTTDSLVTLTKTKTAA